MVLQVHRAKRGAAVARGYMVFRYCRALALRRSSRDVAERFAVYAFPPQTHDLTSACEQVEGASSVVSFAPLGGSGSVALARRGAFAPLASARGLWWPLAGFSGPPRLPSMEPSMDRPWPRLAVGGHDRAPFGVCEFCARGRQCGVPLPARAHLPWPLLARAHTRRSANVLIHI